MHMLYNSDNYAVMQFDATVPDAQANEQVLTRGGYEIVDKFARKEIFIDGALAERFKLGVEALIDEGSASEEDFDDYIEVYAGMVQHPLVMH